MRVASRFDVQQLQIPSSRPAASSMSREGAGWRRRVGIDINNGFGFDVSVDRALGKLKCTPPPWQAASV
jgi:hypothetical protein